MCTVIRSSSILLKKFLLFLFSVSVGLVAVSQIRIEAEDYSEMEGVQTESTADSGGGLNVGYIDSGDWMLYDLKIPFSGEYRLDVRYASESTGGNIVLKFDGDTVSIIAFQATGNWQSWETLSAGTYSLKEGDISMIISTTSGGFNLNWMTFTLIDPIDVDSPSTPTITSVSANVHDLNLIWTASDDLTSAIAGYRIVSDGELLATTTETSFQLQKLAPDSVYQLSLFAVDVAGNVSDTTHLYGTTDPIPWELVWSDEFDGTEVDRDKWNFQTGGGGWGNDEVQYYTDGDNSRVEDGHLIIEARQESIGGNDYTSSRMNTANKGDFLYGRVEVRAKLPSTGGTWPAIWTLPTDWVYGTWPDVGEIDIMEHSATYGLNYVFATIHTKAFNHKDGTQFSGGKTFEDVVNTFHTYVLEWYPDRLDWYYDDEHIFTYDNPYQTLDEWPFDIPHHLLLNVAIGGGLGGTIDHDGVWPQQMIVDYVRMYDFDLGAGDVTPPSKPGDFSAIVEGTSVALNWNTSSDDQYVEKYLILLEGNVLDSVSGSSYVLQCLVPESSAEVGVQAVDFGGNKSAVASTTIITEAVSGISILDRFEAEDYACIQGIELENCTDFGGGLNLAFINIGDWVEYYIDVPETTTYYLFARVASLTTNGSFDLEDAEGNILTSVQTPITGGWQEWKSVVSEGFRLMEGIQKVRLTMTADEFNINWLEFDTEIITSLKSDVNNSIMIYPNPVHAGSVTVNLNAPLEEAATVAIYGLDGKKLFESLQTIDRGRTEITSLPVLRGTYVLQVELPSGEKYSEKLIFE